MACVVKTLSKNSQDVFIEAANILLKFANNILNDPGNVKFRKIRIANPIVMEKLIPVDGAMDCLFAMGFQEHEDGDFLTFPEGASTEPLQKIRDEIESEKLVILNGSSGDSSTQVPQPPGGATGRVEYPAHVASPPVDGAIVYPNPDHPPQQVPQPPQINPIQIFAQEMQFYQRISSELKRVSIYEDPRLQQKALQCIPMDELQKFAKDLLQHINSSSEADKAEGGAIDAKDCFIIELAKWFRTHFFSWVDKPKCQQCNGPTQGVGSADPTADDKRWGAGRVENYFCNQCHVHTRFPRYNHPGKLLETRRGRCGEWANCFTLLCRACGYEARHVIDWTDHVWTEVYSTSQQRWVHSDTGEGGYDKPLLYEAGWGKKLTYVIAFSKDDIQDVTWRYSANHKELLSRRTEVREKWLVDSILKLRKEHQSRLPALRREELDKRAITELVELISEKHNISDGERIGRQTGSLAWRIARGEAGAREAANKPVSHVFRLSAKEKLDKVFHLKYCCARDVYVRVSDNGEECSGWSSGVFECKDVFRKLEADWQMAYLARNEKTDSATVSWKFDFSDTDLVIDQLEVRASSQTFENGQISWRVCTDNDCMILDGGPSLTPCDQLRGCKTFTLTAVMSRGQGENAWQHTQLFRQGLQEEQTFPLEIRIKFK